MKIIKFEVEIFDDINKNTKYFHKSIYKKIRREFPNIKVVVVFSVDMMCNLNCINCNIKPLITYQTIDNIKSNDIFIYNAEHIVLKEYRKQKLKKICSK